MIIHSTLDVQSHTPEDLLKLPDAVSYELADGHLVERAMGWESSWIGGYLAHLLSSYAYAKQLGLVMPADAGYQCFADDPSKVRKPDVSFLRLDRLPSRSSTKGHCHVAPDLAVEVVSPRDVYSDIEVKVDEYLRAGIRLVWVIDPATKSVRVHRSDGTVTDRKEHDDLDGEDVLPGFSCRVADLFRIPPVA